MRLAVAFGAMIQGFGSLTDPRSQMVGWAIGITEIITGMGLLVGFLTPLASASAAIGNLVLGVSWIFASNPYGRDKAIHAIDLVAMSVALILLGPGSFSLDARLFGRREIIIPGISPRRTR
ncbi:DoxX family protein [Acidisarcina polymorpha]|nr:DoxX family protein [Acidisarcina polymorpha]